MSMRLPTGIAQRPTGPLDLRGGDGLVSRSAAGRADLGFPCGPENDPRVCSTEWRASKGVYRPLAPSTAPCEGELSELALKGRAPLRSIYGSCPFMLMESDVPNDDLGVFDNIKYLPFVAAAGASDDNIYSEAMALPTTLTHGATASTAIGVWVRIAYPISLVEAVEIAISTTGAVHALNTAVACNRAVTVQMEAGCLVAEFFLPFVSKALEASIFGPCVALIAATTPTIVVSGPTAASGQISGQWVGAYSQNMSKIFAAIANAP